MIINKQCIRNYVQCYILSIERFYVYIQESIISNQSTPQKSLCSFSHMPNVEMEK
jgi:hypothetical protein